MVSGSTPPWAASGLRISLAAAANSAIAGVNMRQRFGADISRGAVADTIVGGKFSLRLGAPPKRIVAEAQLRLAVAFDLDHEVAVIRSALQ